MDPSGTVRDSAGSRRCEAARRDDPVLIAKLTGIVNFREQLGGRPSALRLYQGYPFDRLRRRLGLEASDPSAIDPSDLSCASPGELAALDPKSLDDHRLIEAASSAAGLRDDERTASLTAELIRRRPEGLRRLDLTAAVSALIRRALARDDFEDALGWIDRARPLGDGRTATTLENWRAEILSRAGRPDEAMRVYVQLIGSETPSAGAALALDGALTLIDDDHLDQARALLFEAHRLARSAGLRWIERRARGNCTIRSSERL